MSDKTAHYSHYLHNDGTVVVTSARTAICIQRAVRSRDKVGLSSGLRERKVKQSVPLFTGVPLNRRGDAVA